MGLLRAKAVSFTERLPSGPFSSALSVLTRTHALLSHPSPPRGCTQQDFALTGMTGTSEEEEGEESEEESAEITLSTTRSPQRKPNIEEM